MEQMSFHKQKAYALIAAVLGVIAMFLPWWKVSFGGIFKMAGMGGSINGMHGVGVLAFIGFLGAGIITALGDKTKPFEGQPKLIAAGCFAGAALFTLIQFIRLSSFTGIGIWLSLIAGIGGALLVYVVKPEQLEKK